MHMRTLSPILWRLRAQAHSIKVLGFLLRLHARKVLRVKLVLIGSDFPSS